MRGIKMVAILTMLDTDSYNLKGKNGAVHELSQVE